MLTFEEFSSNPYKNTEINKETFDLINPIADRKVSNWVINRIDTIKQKPKYEDDIEKEIINTKVLVINQFFLIGYEEFFNPRKIKSETNLGHYIVFEDESKYKIGEEIYTVLENAFRLEGYLWLGY